MYIPLIPNAASGGSAFMVGSYGTATINFGSSPGTQDGYIAVSGQAGISATSAVRAWMQNDTSADHSDYEHFITSNYVSLSCDVPTAGVGFVIYALSELQLTGRYTVRWMWVK